MIRLIENLFIGIIIGLTALKTGEFLIEQKLKLNQKSIIGLILFSIIISLNYKIVDNFLKVITIFIAYTILNKIVYKERMDKSIIIGFIEYINVLISECIVGLVLSIFYLYSPYITEQTIETLKNSLLLNVIIMGLSYILARIFQNKYKKVATAVNKNSTIVLSTISLIILICIGSLFYKIDLLNWQLNNEFLLNAIVIIMVSIIGVTTVMQRLNYEKIENQYKDLAKYSEINATLLEEYSMLNHEHKNQLIIIKGMIEDKNKELENYVQSLLYKKENIKFKWIRELNNISFQGLKSFMNHKILEMKSENLEVYVSVSKQCKQYKLEKMSTSDKDKIYSIIGVFLDNAKDAAKESKEKKVIINAYMEENKMHLEIANTFKGKVDLDRINNYGYTSKGTGHGTGLYMIQNIVRNCDRFQIITEIKEKFFIQKLTIKEK